jgi:GMP synthase (glutamine-hydrolysing)
MFKKHINFIKSEEKSLDFKNKTYEIQNWLDIIKN